MDCIDTTNLISILSIAIPFVISEVLALSRCETNGIVHGIILLCKNTRSKERGPRCNS